MFTLSILCLNCDVITSAKSFLIVLLNMVGFERIIIAGPKLGVFSLLLRNFDSLCPRYHVLDGGPDPHGFMSMTLSH